MILSTIRYLLIWICYSGAPHSKVSLSSEFSLADRVRKLEHDTEERKFNDNLMFARTREEVNTASNKGKEDRIVITSLTSTTPPPVDNLLVFLCADNVKAEFPSICFRFSAGFLTCRLWVIKKGLSQKSKYLIWWVCWKSLCGNPEGDWK
jgi:hypothetical protein